MGNLGANMIEYVSEMDCVNVGYVDNQPNTGMMEQATFIAYIFADTNL